ncbi:RHS repeat-associated core domain-containing protein [Pseudomonas putida]|uniref:RHS repeat-associated core domain-containing protein n=1 Tax=Pseudomonas putida TaxID=303 RepID=UPI003905E3F2
MRSTTLQSKKKHFFFQGDRLVCEASDSPRHLLWGNGMALAELEIPTQAGQILQSDNANSALRGIPEGLPQNYTPYGFLHTVPSSQLVAYSGQRLDNALHCYALGNGHRFYSPTLRRFLQPDTQSPFLKGGPNGYSYCQNDPINRNDPTGQMWAWLRQKVSQGVNWLANQLPRLSVDRPQLPIGNRNSQNPNLHINLHRRGQTPSSHSPHITLQVDDIENIARIGNRILNSSDELAEVSGQTITRAQNFAAGVMVGTATQLATHSILGATNTYLPLAAALSTQVYLDRGLVIDVLSSIRSGTHQNPNAPYIRFND